MFYFWVLQRNESFGEKKAKNKEDQHDMAQPVYNWA